MSFRFSATRNAKEIEKNSRMHNNNCDDCSNEKHVMVTMKTLEKGKDKIKKICEVLREETLEPAQKQAREIINEAHKQSEHIILEAKKKAEALTTEARAAIDRERNVFQSSLQQAAKQSIEALKQNIEEHVFNANLNEIIGKSAADPRLVANLINAIVNALEKEGLAANLSAIIPKTIPERTINELLLHDVIGKLKDQSVILGNFSGGAQVRLHDRKVVIDVSEAALKELLSNHVVRKDFRKMVFESP